MFGIEWSGPNLSYPIRTHFHKQLTDCWDALCVGNTGLSKKMDGSWNRYNLKITGQIYTFGVLKCSEKFKVLDLP